MKDHIMEVAERRVPVDMVYANTLQFTGCRLVYEPERGIGVIVGEHQFVNTGRARISYTFKDHDYIFETDIQSAEVHSPDGFLVRLAEPQIIEKAEIRKYFRVTPFQEQPLRIKLTLPNQEAVYVDALDISQQGIAFPLPEKIGIFRVGQRCHMELAFPRMDGIRISGIIANTRQFCGITRFGISFDDISEFERRALLHYVHSRDIESRQKKTIIPHKRPRVTVVASDLNRVRYTFLEENFDVAVFDETVTPAQLAASRAHLIILDKPEDGSDTLLQGIRKNKTVKSTPIIACGNKKNRCVSKNNMTLHVDAGWEDRAFLSMVDEVIQLHRLNRTIKRRWEELAGLGRRILVLDTSFAFSASYADFLKAHSFETIIVDSVDAAFEGIKDYLPDILLLDDRAEKNHDLLRLLSMHEVTQKTPIILMADNRENAKEIRRQKLISSYITKPLNRNQLFNKIMQALLERISFQPVR